MGALSGVPTQVHIHSVDPFLATGNLSVWPVVLMKE
jgi:hypothetical protein